MNTLHELLIDQLKELYNAENQLLNALPRIANKAESEILADAIFDHLEETKLQFKRLEKIEDLLQVKLIGQKCKAMEGLVQDSNSVIDEPGASALIDAAIVSASTQVEHYEMALYRSAKAIAEQLGFEEVVALLDETLQEEIAADEILTRIGMEEILPAAMSLEEEEIIE